MKLIDNIYISMSQIYPLIYQFYKKKGLKRILKFYSSLLPKALPSKYVSVTGKRALIFIVVNIKLIIFTVSR